MIFTWRTFGNTWNQAIWWPKIVTEAAKSLAMCYCFLHGAVVQYMDPGHQLPEPPRHPHWPAGPSAYRLHLPLQRERHKADPSHPVRAGAPGLPGQDQAAGLRGWCPPCLTRGDHWGLRGRSLGLPEAGLGGASEQWPLMGGAGLFGQGRGYAGAWRLGKSPEKGRHGRPEFEVQLLPRWPFSLRVLGFQGLWLLMALSLAEHPGPSLPAGVRKKTWRWVRTPTRFWPASGWRPRYAMPSSSSRLPVWCAGNARWAAESTQRQRSERSTRYSQDFP